jgi:hypothetical protein
MLYKLIDTFTGNVISEYETEAQAVKAESRLVHEPGEQRYEIVAPPAPKKVSKKKAVKEDGKEEGN